MIVQKNATLRHLNSFQFDVVAEELVIVEDESELSRAFDFDGKITILGDGTNVVLPDRISGRVVHLATQHIQIVPKGQRCWLIVVSGGVNWHELVRYTLGQGIGGLENLALIPGSVGAAPYQNIGAYGCELSERLNFVRVFDRITHKTLTFNNEECQFGYRDSLFKSKIVERYFITEVGLLLGDGPLITHYPDITQETASMSSERLNATAIAEKVVQTRRRKLPDYRKFGNVGSFFENPVLNAENLSRIRSQMDIVSYPHQDGFKIPAAKLIDVAGWRGKRYGQAQVWPQHSLVLVNRGGSSASEVLKLAGYISSDIQDRFDVRLKIEPVIVSTQ